MGDIIPVEFPGIALDQTAQPPQSFVPILQEIRAILRERRAREAAAIARRPAATVIAFPAPDATGRNA